MGLFRHTYLMHGGEPMKDSARMRRRFAAEIESRCAWQERDRFGEALVKATGTEVPRSGDSYFPGSAILSAQTPVSDVLDAVTVFHRYLLRRSLSVSHYELATERARQVSSWIAFVQEVFTQENLGYRVDKNGEVHYHVDGEFARNHASALAVLEGPRFANARAEYEDAFKHLDARPPERSQAARCVFVAAEILAKELVPTAQNLNKRMVEGVLKATCLALLGGDETEQKVWGGMFESFGPWVDAMHNYRHGQVAGDVVEPSEDLTVHILSTGAALVRTLALCLRKTPEPAA